MLSSLQSQSASLLSVYEQCVSDGKLQDDDAQRQVIERLQLLSESLLIAPKRSFLRKLLPFTASANAPRSIYIWGAVGRGKSLLMDMFFDAVPVTTKKRTHFHALMLDVHAGIHTFRQQQKHEENPVLHVAKSLASKTTLLCLDELQVTDVADAMILSKLFSTLLAAGVTFVITSNRPPEELYLGGLQREKFMEFVNLIYAQMDVLNLASPNDYRMQQIRSMQAVYMSPINAASDAALDDTFTQLTHHAPILPMTLEVQGRKLLIANSYGSIARFTFDELCAKPLGSADYLAIARRFHTVFISNIPKLTAEKRNEARRFVTLIDTLYDRKVKLICTAATEPSRLYGEGDGTFEFQRTVSRLAEMQSAQYLGLAHIP